MTDPALAQAPDEIALLRFKVGKRDYLEGDAVDVADLLARHHLDERTVHIHRQQKYIVPLTRENYARAIARRPAGTIGRGFTAAYLIAKGIIDEAPKAPKAHVVTGDEAMVRHVNGYRIVPRKNGNFVNFDVTNQAGELMRARGFRALESAAEFAASLPSTDSPPSATSEGPVEASHDGDVQPGSEQRHLEGAPVPG